MIIIILYRSKFSYLTHKGHVQFSKEHSRNTFFLNPKWNHTIFFSGTTFGNNGIGIIITCSVCSKIKKTDKQWTSKHAYLNMNSKHSNFKKLGEWVECHRLNPKKMHACLLFIALNWNLYWVCNDMIVRKTFYDYFTLTLFLRIVSMICSLSNLSFFRLNFKINPQNITIIHLLLDIRRLIHKDKSIFLQNAHFTEEDYRKYKFPSICIILYAYVKCAGVFLSFNSVVGRCKKCQNKYVLYFIEWYKISSIKQIPGRFSPRKFHVNIL